MAEVRISELTTTATTAASDDYVAVDGGNGTRKLLVDNITATLETQVATNTSDISDLKEDLSDTAVPTTVRAALYTLLNSAAYADTGLTDEIAVIESWATEVTSITLNQTTATISGSGTVTLVATTVPSGGTVTWSSSDTSVATVADGVVTSVANGTATITASCGTLSATCAVTVSGMVTLTGITATYTQSGAVYTTDTLDSLVADLVVTATYDDSSTATLTSDQYTLSGTLTEGTSTITVLYGGKTTTFDVIVSSLVLYRLPQSTTFNGTSDYIDTGLQLMNEDRDFTITLTATNGTVNSDVPIFHCVTEATGYPGLSLQRQSSNRTVYAISGFASSQMATECPITSGVTNKFVIRHTANDNHVYVDSVTGNTRNSKVTVTNNNAFRSSDKNLLIGCYQTTTGTKGRFWNGTINDFTIYSEVLNDSDVTLYLEG